MKYTNFTFKKVRNNFFIINVNGKAEFAVSYETVVGVRVDNEWKLLENTFSPTTGKHLNLLSTDKNKRLEFPEFEKVLHHALENL